jgi:hypothetical protein
LNFKGRGLDDDPFGLFGTPKPAVQPPATPETPPPSDQVLDDQEPAMPPLASPKPSLPDLDFSKTSPVSKLEAPKLTPPSYPVPPQPAAAPPRIVTEALGAEVLPPQAESSLPELPDPSLSIPPGYGEVPALEPLPQTVQPAEKGLSFHDLLILAKQWTRFYFHKALGFLEPVSKKLHIPEGILAVLAIVLLAGLIWGAGALMPAPAYKLVDVIPPLHVVEVAANQISEMDITAYTEFQNQLQTMGFTDILQCTLPQLPNTNFLDVGMKPDVSTYSEIIKFPGTIVPKVSFVTAFTNGVWYSTNGWAGTGQENNWQVSEFFPDAPLDQLYVKHVQRVQQMQTDNGWQAQTLNENRYMAALSDEVRTFLVTKKISAYQADFALWH